MKNLVLCFYAICLFSCFTSSQQPITLFPGNSPRLLQGFSSLPNQFQVNTYQVEEQYFPRIAILSDGKFVIVWMSYLQDGSELGIYAQIYKADGTPYSPEFQVNTNFERSQMNPSITALTNGGFIIVWESVNALGSSLLCAQKYDLNGQRIGGEFLVSTPSDHQINPSVAPLQNDGFIVIWVQVQSTNTRIAGKMFDTAGGSMNFIITAPGEVVGGPTVKAFADGSFIVAWSVERNSYDIVARVFDPSGLIPTPEFEINEFNPDFDETPTVTILSDDSFVVAWTATDIDGDRKGVIARKFAKNGTPIGDQFIVNTNRNGDQRNQAITSFSDGSFLVIWESVNIVTGSYELFGQRFDINGNPIELETSLGISSESSFDHDIAAFENGDFLLAWSTSDIVGQYDVDAKIYCGALTVPTATRCLSILLIYLNT